MALDLSRPIQSEPVLWLALYQSVNEIRAFHSPPLWYLVSLDLNLLSQYVVPDLLPRLTHVWPLQLNIYKCVTRPIMHS